MRTKTLWVLFATISISILLLLKNVWPTKYLEPLVESGAEGSTGGEAKELPSRGLVNHEALAKLVQYMAVGLESHAKIDSLRSEVIALYSLKGSINKHDLRQEILQKLASDPHAVLLAERVFEDFDWVLTEFHEDQAIVRIYAIQLLKTRGLLGEVTPLEQAAQKLAKKLASDPNEWQKGREHDLRDLIGAVIELESRDNILRDVKSFFARVGYVPKLKQVYAHAITSYLYRSGSDDEVDRAFMPFWDEPI